MQLWCLINQKKKIRVTISNSVYLLYKLCIQHVLSRLTKYSGFHLLETWDVKAKHSWEIYDTMASKLQHMSVIPREFTLQYLEQITDNFSEDHIIGRGEHGVVYKVYFILSYMHVLIYLRTYYNYNKPCKF